LGDLSIEVIGGLMLIVITLGVARWAMVLSWAGPLIILMIVAFLGLGLLILNQLHIVGQRRSRGFASLSNDKIEATRRKWLDKERYSIRNEPQSNMLFQFKAEDNVGRNMIVARPKEIHNFIIVGGMWNIPSAVQPMFNNMSDEIRQDMLGDLRIEMLRLKVSYVGLLHPLRQVGVEVRIPCDETCTQSLFLQQFSTARYAYMLLTEVMTRALRCAGHDPDKIPTEP
jgi:hypothetical protein